MGTKPKKTRVRNLASRIMDAAQTITLLLKSKKEQFKPFEDQNLLDMDDYAKGLVQEIGILQATRVVLVGDIRLLCIAQRPPNQRLLDLDKLASDFTQHLTRHTEGTTKWLVSDVRAVIIAELPKFLRENL